MLILAYDFETTGLPLWKEPSHHEGQPHIVQVGACLVDTDQDYKVISSIDLIVRTNNWSIPDEVAKIHGIDDALADRVGVPEDVALGALLCLWEKSDKRMGHNEPFDARIARIAILRYLNADIAEAWANQGAICTAQLATPIVKAPPTAKMIAAGRRHHKTASLSEAYQHFMGKPLEDAHSAMADVLGCIAVYRSIMGAGEAAVREAV
jgi:DNA polymerase III subunit epsilon